MYQDGAIDGLFSTLNSVASEVGAMSVCASGFSC
jgi:hypothetical protein